MLFILLHYDPCWTVVLFVVFPIHFSSWQFSCRPCGFPVNSQSSKQDQRNQVSISPTFHEQLFCWKVFCADFLCLQFRFVIFWQKEISANSAHKMMVKLTTVCWVKWLTGWPKYGTSCLSASCQQCLNFHFYGKWQLLLSVLTFYSSH